MYCGINIGSLYFKYAFGFYNKLIKQKQSHTFYMSRDLDQGLSSNLNF